MRNHTFIIVALAFIGFLGCKRTGVIKTEIIGERVGSVSVNEVDLLPLLAQHPDAYFSSVTEVMFRTEISILNKNELKTVNVVGTKVSCHVDICCNEYIVVELEPIESEWRITGFQYCEDNGCEEVREGSHRYDYAQYIRFAKECAWTVKHYLSSLTPIGGIYEKDG